MKVYAVYSIPKSPEYRLENLFKTKELAKEYIKKKKYFSLSCKYCKQEECSPNEKSICECTCHLVGRLSCIYDIQIEEVFE